MTDTIGVYNGPGGYTVPIVDINVQCTVAVTKGDAVPISASQLAATILYAFASNASAAQRKNAMIGIVLEDAAAGRTARVRMQGACMAKVVAGSSVNIQVGDWLGFGGGTTPSARTLDATPNQSAASLVVNQNRWVARSLEAVASATSAAATLRRVLMFGIHGHGVQGMGT